MKRADFLHKPHDALFRRLFSQTESAASFLREVVPEPIRGACRWDELSLMKTSFLDPAQRAYECDMLYRVPLAGTTLGICLLLEHQSQEDHWMALRLYAYQARAWEQLVKEDPSPRHLPRIIPIVVAQGDRPWRGTPRFAELFEHPADPGAQAVLGRFLPDFEYLLFDLQTRDDVPGRAEVRVVLRLMAAARLGEEALMNVVEQEAQGVVDLVESERNRELIEILLLYVAMRTDRRNWSRAQRVLAATSKSPELEKVMISVTEEWYQEGVEAGLEKGRKEGRQEGRQEGLKTAHAIVRSEILATLNERFGPRAEEAREPLERIADERMLVRLAIRAGSSPTIEDFVASI